MPRICDRLKKMLFIKIPISFTSLIPCLIPPRDDRENSDRTPQLQKVLFVKIAIYVFGHEWRFFCVCTCKNEKNVVTLQAYLKILLQWTTQISFHYHKP